MTTTASSDRRAYGRAQFQKLAAARIIVLTDEQRATLLRLYRRGWHYEAIAAELEVSRGVLRREVRLMGLRNRRHESGWWSYRTRGRA